MPNRITVANPGGQSHLIHAATAFAEVGELDAYVSTFGFGPGEIARLERRLPGPLARRAGRELQRRAVPAEVAAHARRAATAWEVANVLLTRAPLPKALSYAPFRPTRETFDRRVSRGLTPATDAVLGYQGAATHTFRRARALGIARVLDYPIAHYAVAEAILTEEAQLVPEYASTLRVKRYPEWLRRRYEEEIATADRIIMVSGHHRRTFEAAGVDPERTMMVPWYVDSERFSPAGEGEDDDGIFRVAFVGQVTQRKGLSYAIEGFRRAALDDAELVLIGQPIGTSRPWSGIPGVRHVPAMPRVQLPQALRRCHVVALPSLVEGFPVAVLEAMACGLPAIVSENIGHDVVQDGVDGWVVPIRDPDAIAERLRTLHADTEQRRRMARAARAKAERFTVARYRENLRTGVRELLDATRRSCTGTGERSGTPSERSRP